MGCPAAATIVAAYALCVAALAGGSYVPTTLTVQEVLAHARAARGSLQRGTYREVLRTTGDGTTAQTDVYERGDDYSETTRDDGGFTTADGYVHGVGWEQDENGTVATVLGRRPRADPYGASLRMLTDETSVLGITKTVPAEAVLRLVPHRGLVQLRFYDVRTWLLRRVTTTDYDGRTFTYEYSDFRTAYGRTFPQRIVYRDGYPQNARQTQVLSFERVAAAAAVFSVPPTHPVFDLGGRALVRIPAAFTPDGIIVRGTVAGRGLDFEVDSGASVSAINVDVAKQLGLKLYAKREGWFSGAYDVSETRIGDLALGDLHARNFAIEAVPFSRTIGDREIVGILGGDFFASGRVDIDFTHRTLALLAPSKAAPPTPWVSIPIEVDGLVPRVRAAFNGVEGTFIVDLGASATMLYPHYFSQFHPSGVTGAQGEVEGIAGDPVDYRSYQFSSFDLGDLAFADAIVIVASGKQFEALSDDGLLGRSTLRNFNLIFDYPNQRLYVENMAP
jgi:hypothetical protein